MAAHRLGKFFRRLFAPFRWLKRLLTIFGRGVSARFAAVRAFFTEDIEDTPFPETMAMVVKDPALLLPQLNDLRKHLFRAIFVMALTTVFSFTFARQILELLAAPLGNGVASMIAIDVTEPLATLMRIALLAGFALALPYITLEVWIYFAWAFKPRTRLIGLLAIPLVVLFFVGGMAFAYYVMLPTAVPFLLSVMGITAQVRPTSYIGFVTGLMFWVGISFEFPLVIFLLASLGVVKARPLLQSWRLAIVLIAVAAAVITPTVDPVSMGLVMAPLTVLYFLSIGLAAIAERQRRGAA
jgi:sec-independent protein translocase protein TatC